jgi:hypothetical protein
MIDFDPTPRKADWTAVEFLLANFAPTFLPAVNTCRSKNDPHLAATELLMHTAPTNTAWIPDALDALGFPMLANKVTRGESVEVPDPVPTPAPVFDLPPDLTITREVFSDTFHGKARTREVFVVRAPYSPEFNAAKVPARWFDRGIKAWRVPIKYNVELQNALVECFKGKTVRLPDGRITTL